MAICFITEAQMDEVVRLLRVAVLEVSEAG
jgi:hypothetical protein